MQIFSFAIFSLHQFHLNSDNHGDHFNQFAKANELAFRPKMRSVTHLSGIPSECSPGEKWDGPSKLPAMPTSPIASNYPLNKQWAPLAVYGKKAPLQRKL